MSEDDSDVFQDATRDVRPLKADDRVTPLGRRPPPRARQRRAADLATLQDSLSPRYDERISGEIEFSRAEVPARHIRELRRGRYAIEAEIDLHGMTRAEAEPALKEFILECLIHGAGCVRVVHGKGMRSGPEGPVLKEAVQHWLAQWDPILAYTTARPRHGGNGALYVLLKRR